MGEVAKVWKGTSITKDKIKDGIIPVIAGGQQEAYFHNESNRTGDIITISASGAYAGFVNYFTSPIFASDCNTIQSKDELIISTKLIFIFLKKVQSEIYGLQRGQAQPHVYGEDLLNIKIPLPPLDIQQKIVDEIEILEKRESENKEKIELYKSDIAGKAHAYYGKYNLCKLGTVCHEPMYGANESATVGNPEKDYRYIRITDINDDGKLNNEWKTAETVAEKYILSDGDFLFARSGATAGKTFFYRDKFGKALYAGYLIRFKTKADILDASFLNFILKSDHYQSWVLNNRAGTAQPNINAQQYSSFEIPLPPLSEQQHIVVEIEKIESDIARLETELASIPSQKESILKKYL